MIDFIWACLNETTKIKTCSRRYNFEGWNELEFYVSFFKQRQIKVTLDEFENYCKIQKKIIV